MSALDSSLTDIPATLPRLEAGDHLSRDEFERRYSAMPDCKKAELIRGIVYLPSPVRNRRHAEPHSWLLAWLGHFMIHTPGVRLSDNGTLRLGPADEFQPDVLLRLLPEHDGKCVEDSEDYLTGPPEFIAEVSASSVSYDLHVKREIYCRAGVREYLVWRVDDREIDWHVLCGGGYELLRTGPDGLLRSEVFPGLWLDPDALLRGDGLRLIEALQSRLAVVRSCGGGDEAPSAAG